MATTATKPAPRPSVKVKTTQAPFDTARPKGHLVPSDPPVVARSRVIPSDRPVIACSVPGCLNVVIPDGEASCTYRQLRAAARRRKWTRDDLGLDCCPDHPKGRVTEPPVPLPAAPVPVEPEMLDGGVTVAAELPPDLGSGPVSSGRRPVLTWEGGPYDRPQAAPTSTLPVIEAWTARPDDDVWATYETNLEATQDMVLGRFLEAHDEQGAEEGPDPFDEPDEKAS